MRVPGQRGALGAYRPGSFAPGAGTAELRAALEQLAAPVHVVGLGGTPAAIRGGSARLGARPSAGDLPLIGFAPALLPEHLGDAAFRDAHGVRFAYVAGEMANGIASEELVETIARAGALAFFGAAGLAPARVERAIDRLQGGLGDLPFGFNLIHSPGEPALEAAIADLYLRRGVRLASASAFLELTLPVVRYRVHGIRRGPDGEPLAPNRIVAKVSRPEVARRFLSPPPQPLLARLVELGEITADQAGLAARIPMAEDLTAEADSGGHTDNRPLLVLLPELLAVRDELQRRHGYAVLPRIGAAGGIATPASAAAALSLGAAYVMTGSVNQACRESGTSDAVRQMLAAAGPSDVAMAPAADMFEMGVRVQVLARGTMFAPRAARLYELYRSHENLEHLPAAVREELESKYFRGTLEEAWEGCRNFFAERDPSQLERAARDPRHRMALVFRSYLGRSSAWANEGVPDRRIDYQVWCGPAMGAFNDWVRGSTLESWTERRAVPVMNNLLCGAAYLTRLAALRAQGLELPAELAVFPARDASALRAMVEGDPAGSEDEAGTPADGAATREPPSAHAAARVEVAPAFEPVAIVGMGCIFPGAPDLRSYLRLLRTGTDAVREIPASHFDVADFHDPDPAAPDRTYAFRGAFLDPVPFDPTEFGIPPAILEATDTSQLLGLVAARMALEDAGLLDRAGWDRGRTAVILGVTGAQELVVPLAMRLGHPEWRRALAAAGIAPDQADDVVRRIASAWVGWQESSFPGLLGNVVAGRIANRFDLGGTNCVIDAACASSLGAVHLACLELGARRADFVLSGGVDTFSDVFMHMCFSKTPALSRTGDARPFSDRADGTVLGEGLGILVLRRLADAQAAGDRIHAVIRGIGSSSDGRARSIYAPLASGQQRALRAAYEVAGIEPATVGLVEAHGTGTRAGDAAEVEALTSVFAGAAPGSVALGSVKSQIGHTKAAAGSASLIKAALALAHKMIPPTLKADRVDPAPGVAGGPFHLPAQARPWIASGPRRAGVSAFGFGGSNFHAVLEEHGALPDRTAWDGAADIVAFSAPDPARLRLLLDAAAHPADTRSAFRSGDRHRLVLVIPSGASRGEIAAAAAAHLARDDGPWEDAHAFHGVGARAGKLAFLLPGQGSQRVNMLRELCLAFPEMLGALQAVPEIAAVIFPAGAADEAALTRTDVAQPALAAVEAGCVAALARFGVRPDLAAGHSFGELSALHAAGRLDAATLRRLAAARGRLMAGDGEDRGTMLAVHAGEADVEAIARRAGAVVANVNGPRQVVLAGTREAIATAEQACRSAGMAVSALAVGAAFHSPLVAGAAAGLRRELATVAIDPGLPVIADATAEPYPADPDAARELLAAQVARPVRFAAVVEKLHELGARTFVEVGPRAVLTGLVGSILAGRPHAALALDAAPGGMVALATLLARLAAGGHAVELGAWDPAQPRERARRMTVPLTGANLRPARPPESPMKNGVPAPDAVAEALRQGQDALRALQELQERTAAVHQTFLEGQRAAQENVGALIAGQQRVIERLLSGAPSPALPEPVKALSAPVMAKAMPAPIPAVNGAAPAPRANGASAGANGRQTAADVVPALLAVVAETTGYPTEMLQLDMDIEADLGIDSIKRVEILSLLSRRLPHAPQIEPERLGSLRTLRQVAELVGAPAGGATHGPSASNGAAAPHPAPPAEPPAGDDAASVLIGVVAELTGYPRDMLGLEMELEADLGIDSIKRVEILSVLSRRLPGTPQVDPERLSGLRTLRQVLELASPGRPARAEPVLEDAQARRQELVAVRAADAQEGPLPGSATVLGDAPLARALAHALEARGCAVADPAGALVIVADAGPDLLVRALREVRERANRLRAGGTVAVVFRGDGAFGLVAGTGGEAAGLAGLARTIAAEWPGVRALAIDAAAELGDARTAERIVAELAACRPGLTQVGLGAAGRTGIAVREAPLSRAAAPFAAGELVVVTGGARGVTAACAIEIARAAPVTLLLLGRSPPPDVEAAWLAGAADRPAIQRALLEHGAPARTPRELGAAADRVLAAREVRATLAAIEATGARALYRAVDVRDPAPLTRALDEARAIAGPVRWVVHGAGVLRDRRLEHGGDDDARAVITTKIDGLRNLLASTGTDPLRGIALFGSVSGLLGRRGQADYAMANAALAGVAREEAVRRPGCRVVTIDWGPWDGGMVTGPLRHEFEREGLQVLPLVEGARALVAELGAAAPAEVVIARCAAAPDPGWTLAGIHHLDPAQPLLADHVLDGKAVLPVALAASLLARAAPQLTEIAELQLLKGLALDGPAAVSVWTRRQVRGLELELRGADDRVHVRAVARARTGELLATDPGPVDGSTRPYPQALFHGPVWQVIEDVHGPGALGIAGTLRTGGETGVDALALDGLFQLVVLWCRRNLGAPSLPARFERFVQCGPLPRRVQAAVRVRIVEGASVTCDASLLGERGEVLARLDGYVCTVSAGLERAWSRRGANAA